jgi:DNA-directed RNA polymerase beta' subunit
VRAVLEALRFPADAPFDIRPLTADELRVRAPHEVQKSETMNYRTMAPEPGGMFDPKLFGPGTVIDAPLPGIDEMIKPRRTWFARVPLAAPMIHPLLVAHSPEHVGALIGKTATEVREAALDPEANRALVAELEPNHAWTIVRELAILPPDLRPLKLDDHMRWALTPINTWYQRIINRNARLKKLIEQNAPVVQLADDWADLHGLMRGLAENDEISNPTLDPDGDPMPSLRTLAHGTTALRATLHEIVEQGASLAIDAPRTSTAEIAAQPKTSTAELAAQSRPSTVEMSAQALVAARHYIAKAVLFAMGFELAPKT